MQKFRCLVVLLLWIFVAMNSFAGPLVIFHIGGLGDIEAELYDKDKPITVQNFLRYVQAGYYQNTFLHRCPPDPFFGITDFVIQGGQYTTAGNSIVQIPQFPPIVDEFSVGARYTNTYGTLAMAKVGGNTNSATSSWFFNLANNSSPLDNADTNDLFTVFGHVVRGTNVLNSFIDRYYGYGLQNVGVPFDSLPVNYAGTNAPTFANLYYVTISILGPQIKVLTNGTRQISWTSVNGLTNTLEYTTNFPATWQTLTNVIGTGNAITNFDSSTNKNGRFYRVQVLY